jgi:hypothetical protein
LHRAERERQDDDRQKRQHERKAVIARGGAR